MFSSEVTLNHNTTSKGIIIEKCLCAEEQQVFCVRNGVLDEVFEIVGKIGDDSNTQEKLIQKTSCLMGAISWAQPFCDGNKRTALLVIATILYDHGYESEP
ncbi:MAG: Fic family protein [Nitrosopumilus sp.]